MFIQFNMLAFAPNQLNYATACSIITAWNNLLKHSCIYYFLLLWTNNDCSVIQNLSREYKNHIKCWPVPKNADHIVFLYPNLHFQCWILFCWLWIRTLKGPTVEMLPQRNSCILEDKTRESPKDSFTLTNITMNLIFLASKILKNVKVFHKRDKTLMGWN